MPVDLSGVKLLLGGAHLLSHVDTLTESGANPKWRRFVNDQKVSVLVD